METQTSTEQNPTATYEQTGTYTVSLLATNASGCTSVSSLQMVVEEVTGIEDEISEAIHVYPNPVVDQLRIDTSLPLEKIRIIDLYGRIYYDKNWSGEKGIEVSGFPAGLYLLQLEHKGKVIGYKFLKSGR